MDASLSLDRPLPDSLSVREGRDHYLRENGFTVEAYDEAWTPATLLGIDFSVPNTRKHRWGIMLHDLHHVATGFGTDPVGEGEISGWEARSGLGPLGPYVGTIVAGGVALGLLLAPARTMRAFRAGGRSLFAGTPDQRYEDLLDMRVGELRALLGIPPGGLADRPRRLHARAPLAER